MHCSPTRLRAAAAGFLLAAAGALAATPEPAGDAVASLQAAYAAAVPPGPQADFYRGLIAAVVDRVQRSYATEVDVGAFAAAARRAIGTLPPQADPALVFRRAINTALGELDPYSRYLDPRTEAFERDRTRGSFVGIGLQLDPAEDAVRVATALPGGPAARAGLQPGDLIVRVDDQPLAGVPVAEAVAMMRGDAGTPLALTIRRAGRAGDFTVSLVRETIRNPPVAWRLDGKVLLLRINAFGIDASAALREAIADASNVQTPEALVLDLRGNPGGLLEEAVRIADTFLDHGDIVSLRGRAPGKRRTWQADPAELLRGVPIVVLIDAHSASASELLAAALRENGRALVMGRRSFGKGSVQNTYALGAAGSGALRLTSALYYGPAGTTVQRVGVAPDVELLPAPAYEEPRADSPPAQLPQAHVDSSRCSALYQAEDAGMACAIAYLHAGSVQRFLAQLRP
jgi:carboxyl-terminal processing protease